MSRRQEITEQQDSDSPSKQGNVTIGLNGVPITIKPRTTGVGYRTYEVHQRERVGESTAKIKPAQLISDDFRIDPYPQLEILRENYPCYRDWLENCYWISRYNDVTSIFVDDANFETRSKRWFYSIEDYGRDLRGELPVLTAFAEGMDKFTPLVAEQLVTEMKKGGEADLAMDFAARLPLELLVRILDLPQGDVGTFAERYLAMQRGTNWEPNAEAAGLHAIREMEAYMAPLLKARRKNPGADAISAIATLDLEDGPTTAADIVATLLEGDHETLHGGLANMLYLLLTHPDQLRLITSDRRFIKFAWFETLRHSTPVLAAQRFARHEVERFGKMLPQGALMICSAAAGNRDPRIYDQPDMFMVTRKDMCQREPRGMYRADGLPAGIAFGMGAPSIYPAVPEDRPRSIYAITRDTVVLATNTLLDGLPNLRLKQGATPGLQSLRLGEMHTCWNLPVEFDAS